METGQVPPSADEPDGAPGQIRPGITFKDLAALVCRQTERAFKRSYRHGRMGTYWSYAATYLAWAAAVLAALSGLSLAAQPNVTGPLALLTAFLTATIAVLAPAAAAGKHKASALEYRRLLVDLRELGFFELDDRDVDMPLGQAGQLREVLRRLDDRSQTIDEGALGLGPASMSEAGWKRAWNEEFGKEPPELGEGC